MMVVVYEAVEVKVASIKSVGFLFLSIWYMPCNVVGLVWDFEASWEVGFSHSSFYGDMFVLGVLLLKGMVF